MGNLWRMLLNCSVVHIEKTMDVIWATNGHRIHRRCTSGAVDRTKCLGGRLQGHTCAPGVRRHCRNSSLLESSLQRATRFSSCALSALRTPMTLCPVERPVSLQGFTVVGLVRSSASGTQTSTGLWSGHLQHRLETQKKLQRV